MRPSFFIFASSLVRALRSAQRYSASSTLPKGAFKIAGMLGFSLGER